VTLLVLHGRCRSGKRWFWAAMACPDPGQPLHHCDDPVCVYGGAGHDYGWADTEEGALNAMRAAVVVLGGPRKTRPGAFGYYASTPRDALRRLNAAGWPNLAKLREAMVSAHPDRGGTDAAFITARKAYERALQRKPAARHRNTGT
jgi:hypothetical protein